MLEFLQIALFKKYLDLVSQDLLQLCGWAVRRDRCFLCYFYSARKYSQSSLPQCEDIVGSKLPNKSPWLTWMLG